MKRLELEVLTKAELIRLIRQCLFMMPLDSKILEVRRDTWQKQADEAFEASQATLQKSIQLGERFRAISRPSLEDNIKHLEQEGRLRAKHRKQWVRYQRLSKLIDQSFEQETEK